MEQLRQKQTEAQKRLRLALDKPNPMTEYDHHPEFFDPWGDIVDGMVSSYSSEIDRLAIDVLKAIRDRTTFEILETDRGLAAEMMLHIFSDWLCDYGMSPRGAWPSDDINDMWQELIDKWEAYFFAKWLSDEEGSE